MLWSKLKIALKVNRKAIEADNQDCALGQQKMTRVLKADIAVPPADPGEGDRLG